MMVHPGFFSEGLHIYLLFTFVLDGVNTSFHLYFHLVRIKIRLIINLFLAY